MDKFIDLHTQAMSDAVRFHNEVIAMRNAIAMGVFSRHDIPALEEKANRYERAAEYAANEGTINGVIAGLYDRPEKHRRKS